MKKNFTNTEKKLANDIRNLNLEMEKRQRWADSLMKSSVLESPMTLEGS